MSVSQRGGATLPIESSRDDEQHAICCPLSLDLTKYAVETRSLRVGIWMHVAVVGKATAEYAHAVSVQLAESFRTIGQD